MRVPTAIPMGAAFVPTPRARRGTVMRAPTAIEACGGAPRPEDR